MGGNVSPTAEFNILHPIVFDSGLSITMVGWDNSYKYAMLKKRK